MESQIRYKFIVIVIELFVALSVYSAVKEYVSFRLFFVIAFIMYWVLNYILSRLKFSRDISETLIYKVMPRAVFTNSWFGIMTGFAVVVGYLFGEFLDKYSSLVMFILVLIFGGYFVYKFVFHYNNILKRAWGLVALGFLIGMSFGYPYAHNAFVIIVFLVGYLVMYLSHEPGVF